MKKIFLIFMLAAGCISVNSAQAQVRIGVNLNIGDQPVWGPTGYDYAQYYYLPDIDVYYDVVHHEFVYFNNGQWIFAPTLPRRYRNYDLYHAYKVVINEDRPYLHNDMYRQKYMQYRGRRDQVIIRDSRDDRYNHNRDNWRNNRWHGDRDDKRNDRDRDHGHDHDRD